MLIIEEVILTDKVRAGVTLKGCSFSDLEDFFKQENIEYRKLKQTHSAVVIDTQYMDSKDNGLTVGDGLISSSQNIACVMATADCLPILIADSNSKQISAIHAGWRSLCAGILLQFKDHIKFDIDTYKVWLGPCISNLAYEVRQDLKDEFMRSPHFADIDLEPFFKPINSEQYLFDLRGLAHTQLLNLGFVENNIQVSSGCTYQNTDRYYSWRQGDKSDRMYSFIYIKK